MDSDNHKCIFVVFFIFVLAYEIMQSYYIVVQTVAINDRYSTFMKYNLNETIDMHNNYGSDYPYLVTENYYLCATIYQRSSKVKENPDYMFNTTEQIKEDFSEHSEKWRNLYLWCYWGIWGTQIIVLGAWVWRLYEHTCDDVDIPEDHRGSWIFPTAVYSGIQTFKIHIFI